MKALLKKFRSESGSAMTEFVIGLPIFIMIFSGMGVLYRLNHESLIVKADANAQMWADAEASMVGMVPLVGAATSVGSIGDLFQNGLSGAGIYADSGVKVRIPKTLMPGAVSVTPKLTIGGIMGTTDEYVSHRLLNDMVDPTWHGGGFVGAFNSIVQTSGAGPAIAAGMRYGAVDGEATRSFSTKFGDLNFESGKLDVPMPNASVHRVAPVIMTRLALEGTERYKKPIQVFDMSMNLNSEGREDIEEMEECQQEAQDYQNCRETSSVPALCSRPSSSCQDLGGSGALGNFDFSWCGGIGC
jgi:hypothetical protein